MQKVSQSRKQLTAADKKNQLATTCKLEKKETRCRNLWTRGQISDGFSSFDYSVEPVGRYFFVSFVLFPLRRMGAEATLCSTCIAAGWWISCADLSIFFWWRAPFSFFYWKFCLCLSRRCQPRWPYASSWPLCFASGRCILSEPSIPVSLLIPSIGQVVG